jgi:hypothetical protein
VANTKGSSPRGLKAIERKIMFYLMSSSDGPKDIKKNISTALDHIGRLPFSTQARYLNIDQDNSIFCIPGKRSGQEIDSGILATSRRNDLP